MFKSIKGEISRLTPLLCINKNGYFYRTVVFPVPLCRTASSSLPDITNLLSLPSFISCHIVRTFNIYCIITNTQVGAITPLKRSGIL